MHHLTLPSVCNCTAPESEEPHFPAACPPEQPPQLHADISFFLFLFLLFSSTVPNFRSPLHTLHNGEGSFSCTVLAEPTHPMYGQTPIFASCPSPLPNPATQYFAPLLSRPDPLAAQKSEKKSISPYVAVFLKAQLPQLSDTHHHTHSSPEYNTLFPTLDLSLTYHPSLSLYQQPTQYLPYRGRCRRKGNPGRD